MTRREAETLERLLAATPPAGATSARAPEEERGELADLASLARSLESSAAQPAPRFREALRERVLATAAEEPPPTRSARVATVADDVVAAWRYATRSAVASGTLTVLLLLAGIFVGASLSLPGDPLYAIKDAYQQAQLARASAPADVATVQLRMAESKVQEAVRAAERQRLDSLAASAGDADALLRDSAETLLTVYHDSGRSEVLTPLHEFVQDHRGTVADVRERVRGSNAEQPLARLMGTLDRVDGQLDGILSRGRGPTGSTGGFWAISSPDPSLDGCPCLLDDGGRPDDGDGSGGSASGLLPLAPRNPGSGGGAEAAEPAQRWRERIREGVDETREHVDEATDRVIDTVDDVTDGTTEAVDEGTDRVTDTVDGTTDRATDAVDDATDGATDEVTDGVDDAVDRATDAVDDATDSVTNGLTEGDGQTTDAVDDTLNGLLGDGEDSSDGTADTNAASPPAGQPGDDATSGGDATSDDDGSGDGGLLPGLTD